MNKLTTLCVAMAACLAAQQAAFAQTTTRVTDTKVAADDGRCRRQVKEYVDTLRFVRSSAGAQIGAKVADGFVPESDLDKVIAAQGHCAAVQLLRGKGAPI